MTDAMTPIQFVLDHLQHIGWGAVILMVIKTTRFITKTEIELAKTKAEWDDMVKQTTNHMPSMLKSIDMSLRIMSGRDPAGPTEFDND